MNKIYLSRKESIILSAIEIIDELGIHELSIRELAGRQGVSEPALYRHFKSKQDIVLAVLDYYSHFDTMIADTIKKRDFSARDGIRFFVHSYSENLENYPALTAILFSYDILMYNPETGEKIKEIIALRTNTIRDLVEEGQKNGEISSNFSSEDLTDIILGTGRFIILKWRIDKYGYSLKERSMKALESLFRVC